MNNSESDSIDPGRFRDNEADAEVPDDGAASPGEAALLADAALAEDGVRAEEAAAWAHLQFEEPSASHSP